MPNLSRSPEQYYMTATVEGVCFPSAKCVPFADRVACMLMRGPAHSFLGGDDALCFVVRAARCCGAGMMARAG
eukprot:4463150-Pleurochrysis_carterae.AAC.1